MATRRAIGLLIAAYVVAAAGQAAEAGVDDAHLGLNMRSDLGTRKVRVDAGARTGRVDWRVVVDPLAAFGGQQDYDLVATIDLPRLTGWGGFLGHRTTVLGLDVGHAYHEKAIVGVVGRLPALFGSRRVRGQWGAEMAVNWMRHGNDLPTEWISFRSGRHFGDLINGSLFVRFEYAWDRL